MKEFAVMRKMSVLGLAVLSVLTVSQVPATAAPYRYHGTLGKHLDDKLINLYINVRDAEKHDGWCYVPGNSDNRGKAWSCTIDIPPGDFRYKFPVIPENSTLYFSGKMHRAKRSAPADGYAPYCAPDYYPRGDGGFWKNYSCAYWVPL